MLAEHLNIDLRKDAFFFLKRKYNALNIFFPSAYFLPASLS